MDGHTRKCMKNWIITVESTEERHQEIILLTIAKRAHQIFEERGCKQGFELDDWLAAYHELWRDESDGDTSAYHFLVDCPRDPEVTTILSLTAHSLIVFSSGTRYAGEADCGPDVQSVYLFSKELDPAQTDVKPTAGVLHVRVPKKSPVTPS